MTFKIKSANSFISMSMAHSNKQKPGKDFATVNHLLALDICILLIAITSTIMKKV